MAAFADVSEGVRNTLAAYVQALDDGRTDDVVATFCPDGAVDLGDLGRYSGHDELRTAYGRWIPQVPQRHLVLNTLVTDWTDTDASATSDVVFLIRGESGWTLVLVGRYRDTLHRDGDRWRFHHRVAEFVT